MLLTWDGFVWFALPSLFFSVFGALVAWVWPARKKEATLLSLIGVGLLGAFIGLLWASLHRPPLRTMGETRLWYSLFMGLAGVLTYVRWHYRWILSFTALLSAVFCIINLLKPEIHDQSLMPALQSTWFVPHVTVYMFSYALLGCAFLIAVVGLVRRNASFLATTDNLVYVGVALLTFGMLSGAVWAKQAWGHYWSWDPKETWAAITWGSYLLYIHLRLFRKGTPILLYVLLIFAFIALQMCWYGIQFLPSAQGSVHVYS